MVSIQSIAMKQQDDLPPNLAEGRGCTGIYPVGGNVTSPNYNVLDRGHYVALVSVQSIAMEQFDELVEDVRKNGLQQTIWTYKGEIIDGRNRYRACLKAGVEPRFQEWDGKGSLVEFAISLNVKRRHLTSSQLAVVALGVEKQLGKEAQEKEEKRKSETTLEKFQKSSLDKTVTPQINATVQSAKLLNTNDNYVSAAKKIAEKAPELLEHVISGTLTIPELHWYLSSR
jgi:hypothetical protein